jgi:16S rRNA (uracil1498-N3)-methyltransferase
MERRQTAPPPCRITLYQAIPKGKTFDSIIHKATELGVTRIIPLVTEHVIARPEEGELSKKESKWQATAVEATKQCGQPWLPQVMQPRKLSDVLKQREPAELELIGALLPGSKHPRSAFEQFQGAHQRKPASIGVWIGPEGDFAPGEIGSIAASGAVPITLGPLVLKCETAAVYTLSVVSYEVTG